MFQTDAEEEKYTFQYGPCRGDADFLDEMARFLSEQYGDTVERYSHFIYCRRQKKYSVCYEIRKEIERCAFHHIH